MPYVGPGPSAEVAPVMILNLILGWPFPLFYFANFCQLASSNYKRLGFSAEYLLAKGYSQKLEKSLGSLIAPG